MIKTIKFQRSLIFECFSELMCNLLVFHPWTLSLKCPLWKVCHFSMPLHNLQKSGSLNQLLIFKEQWSYCILDNSNFFTFLRNLKNLEDLKNQNLECLKMIRTMKKIWISRPSEEIRCLKWSLNLRFDLAWELNLKVWN